MATPIILPDPVATAITHQKAGLELVDVENLSRMGIFKLIVARRAGISSSLSKNKNTGLHKVYI